MPLSHYHDHAGIDFRAPSSASGAGNFAVPGPAGRRVQFAQATGALPVGAATSETPILALHALSGHENEMRIFFQGRWKVSPRLVTTWEQFANEIKKASPLGKLVVYSHGSPGQLKIDKDYGLEQEKVAALFLGRCQAKTGLRLCNTPTLPGSAFCAIHRPPKKEPWVGPRVHSIEFEGCTVGQRPASLAKFGKTLGAESVSGFTWFHIAKPWKFKIPKGYTAAQIDKLIGNLKKYLVAGQQTPVELADLAKSKDHTVDLWTEYFIDGSESGSEARIPDRAKARSETPDKVVHGSAEAVKLGDEYEESLAVPCVRVVVKLD